ncbi:MAG: lactate utilization protein [Elusimicrobiota bacterium]
MDENTLKYYEVLLQKTADALKKNNFEDVSIVDSKEQAKEKILKLIPANSKVGAGGSMTVRSLGVMDELKKKCNIVQHSVGMPLEERKKIWHEATGADFYLASPQAITTDGHLFFIDKYGNRLSAIIFGPTRVVLVAGYNKVVRDLDEALWRIKNVAAVKNAIRLNVKTPCVTAGKCMDCNVPERICNVVTYLLKRPAATDYTVILIKEEAGY